MKEDFVYFWFADTSHEGANGHIVKIGRSANPWSRAKDIQTACPHKLLQLWVLSHPKKGSLEMERGLHHGLRKFNMRGEWFSIPSVEWWSLRDGIAEDVFPGATFDLVVDNGDFAVGYFPSEYPPTSQKEQAA